MKWQDSLQLKVDSKEQSAPTRFDINHNRPSCATQLVLKSSEKYKERSSDSSLSKNSISFMLPARTSKDDKDNSQTNSNVLEGVTTQNNVY